jgi:hypothetical protein
MKLRFLLAAVILVSTAAPTLASAQESGQHMVVSMEGPGMASEPHFVMGSGPLPSFTGGFIPPALVARVGISQEMLDRIETLTFEANAALITLEADVQRAQLELERLLRASSPDEAAVGRVVDTLSKAEAAVRKNRLGLLIQVRKLLGPELWRKLEAALHEELRQGSLMIRAPFPPGGAQLPMPPPSGR